MSIQGNQDISYINYSYQNNVLRTNRTATYNGIGSGFPERGCQGFTQFQPFDNITGIPIAQVTAGGSSVTDGGYAFNFLGRNGYVQAADELAPVLNGRWRRIMFKNPGGWHFKEGYGGYKMWIDQWQLAKEDNLIFAVDSDLQYFHDKLVYDANILEIIVYIGTTHTLLVDPLVEGREHVRPFLEMGPKVSMAFDAATFFYGGAGYPFPNYTLERSLLLFDEIRLAGHRVYIESRPEVDAHGWYGHIDGSMALADTDINQSDRLAPSYLYGEVIRITQDNNHDHESTGWIDRANITPMLRRYDIRSEADA